jgi:hypothetical protein
MPPEMALVAEFGQTLIADIGTALLEKLQADDSLRGYFREIVDVELEDVYLSSGYSTPALLVSLDEMQEVPQLSGRADLTTVWQLSIVTEQLNARGTGGFLRARVIERIKAVLMGEAGGVLRDGDGNLITEALTLFQRVGRPILVPSAAGTASTIRTPLAVVYTSKIEASTREFEP